VKQRAEQSMALMSTTASLAAPAPVETTETETATQEDATNED